ncbi:MAG: FtsW/RodA/SpoVE family cell cycle protein [Oscillospiraceae bacterium]|nr:FtsW/RodA/SpoVE family cell cycle protein [Oscillospiraceae bacterium]
MKSSLRIRRGPDRGDILLLVLCIVASIYGLVLIASASNYRNNFRFLIIQSVALVLGVLLYLLCSKIDIQLLTEKWVWILILNVLLICSLIFLGVDGGSGNKSWIRFSGLPIGIQPAEIAKVTFALLLARQMTAMKKGNISKFSSILKLLLHLGFMCGLILVVSGDAGMTLAYIFLFLVMAFSAGVKLRWFLLGGGASAAGFLFLWYRTSFIKEYWKNRIRILFDHSLDPLGIGWQQERSVLAIGSGRITGQGLFHGLQTQSASESALPARHTDFIFSVAGEELGIIGCFLILLLLFLIILRCISIARKAATPIDALTAFGLAGMLCFQTILNVGMCLYLAPVVGLTLPFFSYGGTSLITMFAAMGFVSGVKARSLPSWLQDRSGLPDSFSSD